MSRNAIMVLTLVLATPALAQHGALRGKLVDEDGRPLPGVSVRIDFLGGVSRGYELESDEGGDFVRMGIPHGEYRLTFEKEGYQTLEEELRIPPGPPTILGETVLKKVPERAPIAAPPDEIQTLFDRGVAELDNENYPAAAAAFEKVVELAPDSVAARLNLGLIYKRTGDLEKSADYYQQAAELGGEGGYFELGQVHAELGQWSEALAAFEMALEEDATDAEALFNHGAAAMNAGDMAKARASFEKLVELRPDNAAARYQLGMVYVNQGENEAALAQLEKYLELAPDGPMAATVQGLLDYLRKN